MPTSFGGGEVEQGLVGKKEETCFIPVDVGTEGKNGSEFGGQLTFAKLMAAVEGRSGYIDRQDDRQLPLLPEGSDVGMVFPSRDIPVNEACFVAVLVFAVVFEVQATTFEGGMILAAEGLFGQSARLDFKTVHAAHDFIDGIWSHKVRGRKKGVQ